MLQPAAPTVAGETALLAALREEQWQTADTLVTRYGASLACRAVPSGDTSLHVLAALSGDGALTALQVRVRTCLLWRCTCSYLLTTYDLLTLLAVLRMATGGDGMLAALQAAGSSHPHLRLQGMMLYGGLALLNARNAYAHTPLHVAVSRGATRAARCLLAHGANPTLRFDGFSAR